MKSKTAITAAFALASSGLAATPQSPTALNPTGSMPIFFETGLTPKEYGQWLQRTGRQKWVKKSR